MLNILEINKNTFRCISLSNVVKKHNKTVCKENYIITLYLCIFTHNHPKPHVFKSPSLESSVSVFKFLNTYLIKKLINYISNWVLGILIINIIHILNRYPLTYYYINIIDNKIKRVTDIYMSVLKYALVYIETKYPFCFKILLGLYVEYANIINGHIGGRHINLFFAIGIILRDITYFKWLFIMVLAKLLKDYVLSKRDSILNYKIIIKYPFLYGIIISLLTAIYLLSLYTCVGIGYECLILPFIKKIQIFIKNINTIILKMLGFGGGDSNPNPSPGPNSPGPSPSGPNPAGPNPPGSTPPSNTDPSDSLSKKNLSKRSKGKKRETKWDKYKEKYQLSEEDRIHLPLFPEYERVKKACNRLSAYGENNNMLLGDKMETREFLEKYNKFLPSDAKEKIRNQLESNLKRVFVGDNGGYSNAPNVKTYWERVNQDSKNKYQDTRKLFQVFEENSKKIKRDNLGGPNSPKSKLFNEELNDIKSRMSSAYKDKEVLIKNEIKSSEKLDAMMKERGIPVTYLFEHNFLRWK